MGEERGDERRFHAAPERARGRCRQTPSLKSQQNHNQDVGNAASGERCAHTCVSGTLAQLTDHAQIEPRRTLRRGFLRKSRL